MEENKNAIHMSLALSPFLPQCMRERSLWYPVLLFITEKKSQEFRQKNPCPKRELAIDWHDLCGVLGERGYDKKLRIPVRKGISLFVHRL